MSARLVLLLTVATAACSAASEGTPNGEVQSDERAAADDAATQLTGTSIQGSDTDQGAADPSQTFRALMVLPLRSEAALGTLVTSLYTPGNAHFRQYLTASAFAATYAPTSTSVDTVSSWIASHHMNVDRVATNRSLIQFSGPISAFNAAFGVALRSITRGSASLYATSGNVAIPAALAGKIAEILSVDAPPATGSVNTTGTIHTTPPPVTAARLEDARAHYGVDDVEQHGAGETIGIVGAGAVRTSDAQSFWRSQGVTRPDVVVVRVAEPPTTINLEATLDVQWSGGMAPEAGLRFYQGPDTRDTSLVFAFNEAVGRGEVTVITDSFAHNESVEPVAVRMQYDRSALAAAAMGITVLSASGDTGHVDTPASSPYVTAVGGTTASGSAWSGSGCGPSTSFVMPAWQMGAIFDAPKNRATVDMSAIADNLWYYAKGWSHAGGTSFASPLTSGLMATVNSIRTAADEPRIGWLNPILYANAAVHATFNDITTGASGKHAARKGWDYPTGWGTPNVGKLAAAIP